MQRFCSSTAAAQTKTSTWTIGARTFVSTCALLLAACGGGTPDPAAEESSSAPAPNEAVSQEVAPAVIPAPEPVQEKPAADPIPFQDLATADILDLNQRWTGDYDELEKRRFLRVLVPFSRTLYYLD